MGLPHKHHYIPKFYTKRWTDDRGLLCQFDLHPRGVAAKRRSPDGVGFKHNLYSIPGVPPDISEYLEDKFFRDADQGASDALDRLIARDLDGMSDKAKSAWARFIMGLLQRTPEKVEWLGKVWAGMHAEAVADAIRISEEQGISPGDMGNLENSVAVSFARVLQQLMDLPNLGRLIVNMRWAVLQLHEHKRLMTSDRPVVLLNGVEQEDALIAVPLSPSHIFLAANKIEILRNIAQLPVKQISSQLNHSVVAQAQRYVYAVDDSQFRFVAKHIARDTQFMAPPHLLAKYPRE